MPFLNTVLRRLRRVTQAPVLLRLDSGHDAEDTRREIANHSNVDHIIKLNPRKQYTVTAWLPAFEEKGVQWNELRPGKTSATLSISHETDYAKQRLIIRIIKRTTDSVGQYFLTPDYELEGWWTTLDEAEYSDDNVILLYEDHATSEQFHSEFKTDMDLERLPSGKFDTNDLVMCLGALTYVDLQCFALHGSNLPDWSRLTDSSQSTASKNQDSYAGTGLPISAIIGARSSIYSTFWSPQSRTVRFYESFSRKTALLADLLFYTVEWRHAAYAGRVSFTSRAEIELKFPRII